MLLTTAAATFALLSSTFASPIATRAVDGAQKQITVIENKIGCLANKFVQSDAAAAKEDYAAGATEFDSLAKVVLATDFTCPVSTAKGYISERNTALEALQWSQDDLDDLSQFAKNSTVGSKGMNDAFCGAYSNFKLVRYFSEELVGDIPSAIAFDGQPVFNETRFISTFRALNVALESLTVALAAEPATAQSGAVGEESKTALQIVATAVTNFKTAGLAPDGVCPQVRIAPPDTPALTIERVALMSEDAKLARDDKIAGSEEAAGDFCRVQNGVLAVNAFVVADVGEDF